LVEQLICNQPVGSSSLSTSFNLFPAQRAVSDQDTALWL
jgi:hypothetical protein